MKIFVIHSSRYYKKVIQYKAYLEREGHQVYLPVLDSDHTKNSLGIVTANRAGMEWADECHIFWDRSSTGSIFDMGMCFMARKPWKLIHLNDKSLEDLINQYEEISHGN